MFLLIPPNFKNLWAYYHLLSADYEIMNVGVVKFSELTQINDNVPEPGYYISVIDTDEDRYKLANRAISDIAQRGKPSLQWTIQGIATAWKKEGRAAHPVICVETSELFDSANAAATAKKLSYSQLINHLNGKIGFKTVKGNRYRWKE